MNASDNDKSRDASIKATLSRLADSYRPSLTAERLAAARGRHRRTYGAAALGIAVVAAASAVTLTIGQPGTQHPVAAPASQTSAPQTQPVAPATSSPSATGQEHSQPARQSTPAPGRHQPACTVNQIQITVKEWGFTMPGNVVNIIFRNTSATACTLTGWPKVKAVNPTSGSPVTTQVRYPTVPVKAVTLAPAASAKAGLLIWDPPGGCAGHSFAWLITTPGTHTPTRILENYSGGQSNIFEICSSQTQISVSPIRP